MKKNKEVKDFSDYLNQIENLSNHLMTFPDDSVSKNASTINQDLKQLRSGLKGMQMTVIVLAIVSIALFFLTISTISYYNGWKKAFSDEFEARRDSILNFNKNDTIMTVYTDPSGKLLTYKNLFEENIKLQDSLNDTKFLLNYAVESYGIKFKTTEQGNKTSYSITSTALEDCQSDFDKSIEIGNKLKK